MNIMQIEKLRVERLVAPNAIVEKNPEFTWVLNSENKKAYQAACEIEVKKCDSNGGSTEVWRSGKLERLIGEEVLYSGTPLASRTEYKWRVRVWDQDGQQVGWSDWSIFETGVMKPDRIEALWICGGGALRRQFNVSSDLRRARAYVSGLGYYEFFCNGEKMSKGALAPSFTEFDRRVEYEVIDLTSNLKAGGNSIGFLLADGWWRHGASAQQTRSNQAIAEVILEYLDGRREVLTTDESWLAAQGPLPTAMNSSPHQLFDGVTLDLSWMAGNWCEPEAEALDWNFARIADNHIGELVPSLLPPVREVETLRPYSVNCISDNLLLVEFSQNFTGWIRFKANAYKEASFRVKYAEILDVDGRLNTATLRTAQQTDTFILAGIPDEIVEPRFVYHGFRYVEIDGPISTLDVDSILGVVIHSAVESVGKITTSDSRINWLLESVRWTVRSNAMSVMTDVCQRDERRGWLMDGVTALKAGLIFYDMNALGRKWIQDMIDNQEPDGSLRSDSAPMWFSCKSVGWQRAIVLLPIALYEAYGDRLSLCRAFPHMVRYADFLMSNLQDGLLPKGFSHHPSEWLSIGKRNDQVGDNALAIDVLEKVAFAADILGDPKKQHYVEAAKNMAMTAQNRWLSRKSNCFGGDGGEGYAQSNQVYALRFGLLENELCHGVFNSLVDDLLHARGDGPFVTTGIGSTEHLPIVLSEHGRDDLVWRWIQRDAYPGYGFMEKNGATSIWECWELRTDHGMNAHNHTGLSGIGTWLKEYLIGIRTEPGPQPIFHLRPALCIPLKSLRGVWQSQWGEVSINWETQDESRLLTIHIPIGCRGRLYVSNGSTARRSETYKVHELSSGVFKIRL